MFSFGMILWEIWTRQIPFQKYRFNYEVQDAVLAGERPVVPESCPKALHNTMTNCWRQDASARPSFPDVLQSLRCGLADLEKPLL